MSLLDQDMTQTPRRHDGSYDYLIYRLLLEVFRLIRHPTLNYRHSHLHCRRFPLRKIWRVEELQVAQYAFEKSEYSQKSIGQINDVYHHAQLINHIKYEPTRTLNRTFQHYSS